MSAPAIRVTGLVKRYPVFGRFRDVLLHPTRKETRTALDGVDLDVKPGRCFCLLGPNGAGKTTLIKILTTLVLPDEGKAFVGGRDVEQDPVGVRRRIGFAISEERSFYWRLTGRQNLEFFGALNGLRRGRLEAKISEVLRLTRMEEAAGLRFNTYSTGMRQMLAFARALMTDADILFVDEPTRSLDPQAASRVRAFLRTGLVDGGEKTVFWATHNLVEAAEVAHEIAVIDRGRIRVSGTVESLTDGGRTSLRDVYDAAVPSGEAPEEAAGEEGPR